MKLFPILMPATFATTEMTRIREPQLSPRPSLGSRQVMRASRQRVRVKVNPTLNLRTIGSRPPNDHVSTPYWRYHGQMRLTLWLPLGPRTQLNSLARPNGHPPLLPHAFPHSWLGLLIIDVRCYCLDRLLGVRQAHHWSTTRVTTAPRSPRTLAIWHPVPQISVTTVPS